MLLNENEVYLLWTICNEAIYNNKRKLADVTCLQSIKHYSEIINLAVKLSDFLEPLDSLNIEEGPF